MMFAMRRLLPILLLTAILLSSSALIHDVHASTVFHGIIISNTIWTTANSPYSLDGPAAVNQGVTLTIEPGVTVNLNNYYLQINGTLNAQGTSDSKIVFNADQQSWQPYSYQARLDLTAAGSESTLENAILPAITAIGTSTKVSKCTIPEIDIRAGSPTISDCSISKITISDGSPIIKNNDITGEFTQWRGVPTISANTIHSKPWTRGGSPTFIGNILSDGIDADSAGGTIIIANNEITSTSNYNIIYVQGRLQVTISNNRITGNNNANGISVMGILSSATITQNQISNCNTAMDLEGTFAQVTKNTLSDSNIGLSVVVGPPMAGASGEYAKTPQVNAQENTISNNTIGLQYTPYAGSSVVNNNIQDNTQYDLKLQSPNDLALPNNYWGTTDTAAINQKIFDYKHDFNLGHVTITPILSSPVPQYSPDVNAPVPTFVPLPTQTSNPTQSTGSPTATPMHQTASPTQSGTQSPFNLNTVEVAILAALVIIAVLLVVLIVTLRKRR